MISKNNAEIKRCREKRLILGPLSAEEGPPSADRRSPATGGSGRHRPPDTGQRQPGGRHQAGGHS